PVFATLHAQIRWWIVSRLLPVTAPTRKTISHDGLARGTPTTSRPITTTQLEISGIRAEGVNISPCRSRRASLIHQAANIVGRRIPKAKIVSRGKSKPRPTTPAATSTSCAANHLMAFAPKSRVCMRTTDSHCESGCERSPAQSRGCSDQSQCEITERGNLLHGGLLHRHRVQG